MNENANKKNDENNSELGKDVISSNSNKSFILNSITDADSGLEYNIYAVSDYGQIIGYKDSIYMITDKNIDTLYNSITSKKSNIVIDIPGNYKFIKSYSNAYIIKNELKENYKYEIKNSVFINGFGTIKKIDECSETDNFVTYLDSSEIKLPIYVRNRVAGDKMVIKNMDVAKKIKNIFIDCKLPIDKRDNYPIVVDASGEIIWLPGLKKSKFDRKNSGKYDIILKYE